jgi:hypothetical protein
MPNGTAHTAMSSDAHGATPRRRRRNSMTSTETTMPRTMQIAYARTGSPKTCHTDVVGLGIAARFTALTVPPGRDGAEIRGGSGHLLRVRR